MIRLMGPWLAACALCIAPAAADENVYDGPTAIAPLTVAPKPQQTAPPSTDCDFEHQCYPEKGGPMVKGPAAPPVAAARPAARRPAVAQDAGSEDPLVTSWQNCMSHALQAYEQSHDLHAFQAATGSCQERLEARGGENFAGVERPMPPTAPVQQAGRRNIGCGWWPIGSDADRDCAAGGRRF